MNENDKQPNRIPREGFLDQVQEIPSIQSKIATQAGTRPDNLCKALTTSGKPCRNRATLEGYCIQHYHCYKPKTPKTSVNVNLYQEYIPSIKEQLKKVARFGASMEHEIALLRGLLSTLLVKYEAGLSCLNEISEIIDLIRRLQEYQLRLTEKKRPVDLVVLNTAITQITNILSSELQDSTLMKNLIEGLQSIIKTSEMEVHETYGPVNRCLENISGEVDS